MRALVGWDRSGCHPANLGQRGPGPRISNRSECGGGGIQFSELVSSSPLLHFGSSGSLFSFISAAGGHPPATIEAPALHCNSIEKLLPLLCGDGDVGSEQGYRMEESKYITSNINRKCDI